MNMPCRASQAEKEYMLNQERYEEEFDRIRSSPGNIRDGLSFKGVRFPAHIKNIVNKTQREIAEADYLNALEADLSDMVKDEDWTAIGEFLGKNAKEYITNLVFD